MTVHHPRRAGLRGDWLCVGSFPVQDSTGTVVNCNCVGNMMNDACWGVLGGSTGVPVAVNPATGQVSVNPATGQAQPDCSQTVNWINGACSLTSVLTNNPLFLIALGIGVLYLIKDLKN